MIRKEISFTWDPNKNKTNQKKHGLSFEAASFIFEGDPFLLSEIDDRYDYSEIRWQSTGLLADTLISVSHTLEEYYEEEIIRIISAREASSSESRRYGIHRRNEERTTGFEASQSGLN